MAQPQRILVIGIPGSGKSTLAGELADKYQLPLVRMDQLFWKNDHETISGEELLEKLKPLLKEPKWVMDGNYSSNLELRLQRADTVIWLKVSRFRSIWRVLKRYRQNRGKTNPHGNPDLLDWDFIKFIWAFPKNNYAKIEGLLDKYQHQVRVIKAGSGREVLEKL